MDAFVGARPCGPGAVSSWSPVPPIPRGVRLQTACGRVRAQRQETLLEEIGETNARLAPGRIGPIGAVVGPTHLEPGLDLVAAHGLFLAPGVGGQGATPADVARVFAACPERVMPQRVAFAAGRRGPTAVA